MVSVKRFIHDEPALFKATAEFVRLFARIDDPVLTVAKQEKGANERIAWTLLGTALFQDVSYPEFVTLFLDWRLVSYMVFYMFQCHSPKSPHPLPLPQSP